jgi:putative protease
MNRRLYVTVNTVFEQREADRVYQFLKYLASLGPDGVIVQDFGTAKMIREHFPVLKLHASTQMNIASARGANALSKYGFSRVVLARELSPEEIRDIRANTNMAIETFVHGALCVSASGLCLFSSYLGGKSANRGMCTQACRRLYRHQDENGYFFSPGDLQLIDRVPELADAGVNSFKIEGRMKSAGYVGTVVAAYRRVIDGLDGDRERSIREGLDILRNDFARTKTYFYFSDKAGGPGDPAAWLKADQDGSTGIPLGTILKVKGRAAEAGTEPEHGGIRRGLIAGGPVMPGVGDSVRFHRKDDSDRQSHKLTLAEDEGGGDRIVPARWISIPNGFDAGDSVYLIQTKAMTRRYPPVIKGDLDSYKRTPGHEKAPELVLPSFKDKGVTKKDTVFPAGVYAAVSRIEDLYILQSVRPARVMLHYNRKTAACLLGENRLLPFKCGEIILVLDPYFPQAVDAPLSGEINRLMERGYRGFVVNNPGHFSLFRGNSQTVNLIAGPYLYGFNRWAAAFISSMGTDWLVCPLENNRQNWERTMEPGRRALGFVTVFAYPALFRIRADLGKLYHFNSFQDSRDEQFRLVTSPDGTLVYPERPFSIIDKIPFLQKSGFLRFILDFSGPVLKKTDYKDIMTAVKNAVPLPNTVRFNWKDGFYTTEQVPLK